MEKINIIKSLINPVKEAYFEVAEDGKYGKIYCRKRWSTSWFNNKEIAFCLLGFLLGEKIVSLDEFSNLKEKIKTSTLPDK